MDAITIGWAAWALLVILTTAPLLTRGSRAQFMRFGLPLRCICFICWICWAGFLWLVSCVIGVAICIVFWDQLHLGPSHYPGDRGPAISAALAAPVGVAVSARGDVYIAESANNCIRKVDAVTHRIKPVWGKIGLYSYPNHPEVTSCSGPIKMDLNGNLLIVETGTNRISRLDLKSGRVTTIAGQVVAEHRGAQSPAIDMQLSHPSDIAVGRSGDLYVADLGNHRVCRINTFARTMTIVAGNGRAGFSGDGGPAIKASIGEPSGVGIDAKGNLFIPDQLHRVVRMVDGRTGIIHTIAGIASEARFFHDSSSFEDHGDYGAPNLKSGGGCIATKVRLGGPGSLLPDSKGNLYICDYHGYTIYRMNLSSGIARVVAGTGDDWDSRSVPALKVALSQPLALSLDPSGDLFIADRSRNQIFRLDHKRAIVSAVAGNRRRGEIIRRRVIGIYYD